MLVREDPRDVAEQAVAVERLDLELDEEDARRARRPLDVDEPVRLAAAGTRRWCSRRRCTETPLPRVTKPMIGSPGTGVQHLASLTQHVGRADDDDPGIAGCAGVRGAGGDGRLGEVLAGALLAAQRRRRPADDVLGETWPSPTAAYRPSMSW